MNKNELEIKEKYANMRAFQIIKYKGSKRYFDYWLCWMYENKLYCSRINPLFEESYRILVKASIPASSIDDMKLIAKVILM